jgi:hypothetical protein
MGANQHTFPKRLKNRGSDRSDESRLRLKCHGSRAETRFRLSTKRTSPFKLAAASVQSTTGRPAVHIILQGLYCSCKPVFCSHVTLTDYPLHSLVSPSLLLPCVTVCHHISNGLYCKQSRCLWKRYRVSGRAELRLAASRPCRLQLCAANKQPGHSQILMIQWWIAETAVSYLKVISWWEWEEQHWVCPIAELTFETRASECARGVPVCTKCFLGRSVETGEQGFPQKSPNFRCKMLELQRELLLLML